MSAHLLPTGPALVAESPPGKKEAAPDRAPSSGDEASAASHVTHPLVRLVTKYASAEDSKGE